VSAQSRPDREQGVLETLLVLEGRAVELDAHLERIGASLAALFPDRPAPRELGRRIEAAARRQARGALRLLVAPAVGVDRLEARIEPAPIRAEEVLPAAPPRVGCASLTVTGGLGAHKWADREMLERAVAGLPPGTVPLIVDWDGAVLEAARANVFAVVGETLLTPPVDGRILPGVSRARALSCAAEIGLEARETAMRRERLADADEVFLTSSVRGVERVASIDGVRLHGPGPIGEAIAAAMRRAWSRGASDRVPRR
jgi:para-aminobenzoate synthetase / 4-amino-4-deoxychorismate lyase